MNQVLENPLSVYTPSFSIPWNEKQIQYLFRRIGYGVSLTETKEYISQSPNEIIDGIINKATEPSYTPSPKWAKWSKKEYQKTNKEIDDELVEKHALQWAGNSVRQMHSKGFREKIVLFWSNHFVTAFWNYESPVMLLSYHRILQKNALGNFKEFVKEIGLTPAMLTYLNGIDNTAEQANENYARELLELFTLGRDNGYTQKDIAEIARAFSGYDIENWTKVYLDKAKQDEGEKIIFGKTGYWDYNDVIDILFEEKGGLVARHICTEIYKAFVYHIPNELVISELTKTFLESNFEIAPVFKQLFKSEHFFSEEIKGAQIKSPYDLILTFINELDIEIDDNEKYKEIFESCYWIGQALFNPPDVSGWKGQRNWIDATKLTRRWQVMEGILYDGIGEKNMRQLITFTHQLTDERNDSHKITKAIVDYFLPFGLQSESDYQKATEKFKAEWPKDVFETGWWNLDRDDTEWQVASLLCYLFRLPEFHLC